jgi:hypothetical protein
MKTIKVVKNGNYKGKYIFKNDIIEPTKENFEMIKILNEKGFIEPLNLQEINEIERFINKPKFKKEEE